MSGQLKLKTYLVNVCVSTKCDYARLLKINDKIKGIWTFVLVLTNHFFTFDFILSSFDFI